MNTLLNFLKTGNTSTINTDSITDAIKFANDCATKVVQKKGVTTI